MPQFYLWTVGCQMNKADSDRLGSALEDLGYEFTNDAEQADMVILNSCVVRQGAEDKVAARLNSLQGWKRNNPNNTLTLMGCMVGPKTHELHKSFPHVDVFMRPQEFEPLIDLISDRKNIDKEGCISILEAKPAVSTYVPIIHGCDKFCTFCIVPFTRGRERSRPMQGIIDEATQAVHDGFSEITLLGQNVNSYGWDLEKNSSFPFLLQSVASIEGLDRVRFTTSHPRDLFM